MRFDPRPYAEHYRLENEAELSAIRERASAALAEDGPRRKEFDIDLDLDGGDLDKALVSVEGSAFDVDVVQLDRLPPHVRARVDARGIVLAKQ